MTSQHASQSSLVTRLCALRGDARGAVTTEYLVITCVCLGLAAVLAGLGLTLDTAKRRSLEILASDVP